MQDTPTREGVTQEAMRGGAVAIVGFGELKPDRPRPGPGATSLLPEEDLWAVQGEAITEEDTDGFTFDPSLDTPTIEGRSPGRSA